jgi:glutathione S-transferase
MKLYSSPLSPYGRKVKIAAAMKGLSSKIEVTLADTNKGDPELNRLNPLAKIPCLLADGQAIFDSHVICEYLDAHGTGPVLFPAKGSERWKTLTLGALADGMLDAALLLVYEKRFRPEDKHVAAWTDRQWAKVNGALDQLEKAPPAWSDHPDYGHVTLACALGYLDLRHGGTWRPSPSSPGHPKLVAWLDRFATAVPSFGETTPKA